MCEQSSFLSQESFIPSSFQIVVNHETNFPAELEEKEKHTRFPSENEIEDWPEDTKSKARKRTARSDRE
ncbi:MAG TPA: hypothetical protein VJ044_05295 [Candidatus Hodarchaeales archaeon]|jgi:hypothetical protein|nr:hypothetical protein [Candidatus Hodarchaeales archaeon]